MKLSLDLSTGFLRPTCDFFDMLAGCKGGIQGELFGADRSSGQHGFTKPKGSIGVLAGANGTEPGCLGMNRGFPQLVYQQALNLY